MHTGASIGLRAPRSVPITEKIQNITSMISIDRKRQPPFPVLNTCQPFEAPSGLSPESSASKFSAELPEPLLPYPAESDLS